MDSYSIYNTEWQNSLLANERLLWSGKPKGGFRWMAADFVQIPFALFWNGFVVFWIFMASSAGGAFGLFGVPHALVGIYLLFGRYIYDIQRRKNTSYALTNQRVLIKNGIFSKSTTSLALANLPELVFSENRDMTFDIAFGTPTTVRFGRKNQTWEPPTFEALVDGKEVYQLLLEQQKKSNSQGLNAPHL